jgi:hypothetical protein
MTGSREDKAAVDAAATELRQAWDDLIGELQAARDTIDDPDLFAPAANPRVLAEGYRYLSGFIHHGIERAFHEDPERPAFRNALSIFNKATIENPDAIYFYAPIDGRRRYLVKGRVEDFRHWRGDARVNSDRTAPQYLIFEVSSGPLAGDTGDLRELIPGAKTGFGTLDSSELQVGEDGQLELLLAPERPDGYAGNFICTRKPPSEDAPEAGDRYAGYISGRQLFYDWKNEEPVGLTIVPLDAAGSQPATLRPETAAANLRRMGALIRGQMRFWLHFYDVILNPSGTHGSPEDGRYFMPVNAYNRPNAASSDTGGGMSTNIYAGGIFDLQEDEALYVEATCSGQPVYTGIHLGNLWGESPDYANHQSSLNAHQMYLGDDGIQRWVVAHRDPGIRNWIDTTGLPRGYVTNRWAYSEIPDEADWPKISARKIRFDEIRAQFPADMPSVSEAERREEIAVRQEHVQRRYRVF